MVQINNHLIHWCIDGAQVMPSWQEKLQKHSTSRSQFLFPTSTRHNCLMIRVQVPNQMMKTLSVMSILRWEAKFAWLWLLTV
jgi:hypothetical protein